MKNLISSSLVFEKLPRFFEAGKVLTKMVEKYQLSSWQPIGQICRLLKGRAIQLTFGRTPAWVTNHRKVLCTSMKLKIRYVVHCSDGRLIFSTHTCEVGVWSVNSGNIYTRNWKRHQRAAIYGTALIQPSLGEKRVETRMWLIICLPDKYVVWALQLLNNNERRRRRQSMRTRAGSEKRTPDECQLSPSERSCDSGCRRI